MYLPLRAWKEVLANLGISRRSAVRNEKRPKQMKRGARLRIIESLEERRLMTTTLYWDPSHQIALHSGDKSYGGGIGTWDTTSTNNVWWDGSTDVAWNNSVDNNAVFTGTTTSTVTMSSGIVVGNIDFCTDGDALEGGSFELGGSINVASGLTDSISSTMDGPWGLQKTGGGMLIVSGDNSYTSGTGIYDGTLQMGSQYALGSEPYLTMGTSGTLDLNGYNENALGLTGYGGGIITNNGPTAATLTVDGGGIYYGGLVDGTSSLALVKEGSGSLYLGYGGYGGNLFSGGTTIESGTIQSGYWDSLGSGGLLIDDGGTLDLDGNGVSLNGTLSGTSGSEITNSGSSGAGMSVTQNSSSTFAGTIADGTGSGSPVSFNFDGPGQLTLSGSNTYSGGTSVAGGTLQVGSSTALGTGEVDLFDGTLDLDGHTLSGTSTIVVESSAEISNSNTSTTGAFNGSIDLGSNALTIDDSGNVTLGGQITGTGGSLIEIGSATLKLGSSTSNTYSGGTTIYSGTLQLNGSSALGTGTLTMDGGTLDLGGQTCSVAMTVGSSGNVISNSSSTTGTYSGTISLGSHALTIGGSHGVDIEGVISGSGGSIVKNGSGTLTVSGSNTYTSGTAIDDGTLLAGSSTALGTGGVALDGGALDLGGYTVTGPSSISVDSPGSTLADGEFNGSIALGSNALTINGELVLGGVISGSGGSLVVGGSNTVEIGSASSNTYTGGTTIDGGTLELEGSSALGTGSVTLDGGALDLNGQTVSNAMTVSSSGSYLENFGFSTGIYDGTINLGSQQLSIDVARDLTVNGVISGASGSLLLTGGSSTLTLTATNTYGGGTTIVDGTLSISADRALGDDPSSPTTNITFAGSDGVLQFTTDITLSPDRLITIDSGDTATLDTGANTVVYAGTISGAGSLDLTGGSGTGSGKLELTSQNTYSGPTTINSGILEVDNYIMQSAVTIVGDGTTVGVLQGDGGTGPVSIVGGIYVANLYTVTIDNTALQSADPTYSGETGTASYLEDSNGTVFGLSAADAAFRVVGGSASVPTTDQTYDVQGWGNTVDSTITPPAFIYESDFSYSGGQALVLNDQTGIGTGTYTSAYFPITVTEDWAYYPTDDDVSSGDPGFGVEVPDGVAPDVSADGKSPFPTDCGGSAAGPVSNGIGGSAGPGGSTGSGGHGGAAGPGGSTGSGVGGSGAGSGGSSSSGPTGTSTSAPPLAGGGTDTVGDAGTVLNNPPAANVSDSGVSYGSGTDEFGATSLTDTSLGIDFGQSLVWTNQPGAASGVNGSGMTVTQLPQVLQVTANEFVVIDGNESNVFLHYDEAYHGLNFTIDTFDYYAPTSPYIIWA